MIQGTCTATLIAAGSSVLPALVVDVTAGADQPDAREVVARLASAGLTRLAGTAVIPGPAAGWMVLACPGPGWIDVLGRSPDLQVFFSGACAVSDEWRALAAETGNCLLLAGRIGLGDVPDAAPAPALIAQMVDAAGVAGLVAGGLVPVYWPGNEYRRNAGVWPGSFTSATRARAAGGRMLPGVFVTAPWPDGVGAAVDVVRAQAPELSRELARQRLVTELLLRGIMPPPRIVDQLVDVIMQGNGLASGLRRALREQRAGLATGWLTVQSVAAWALHRPLPHWHIWGLHVVRPAMWAPWLDVVVDPGAAELLTVGAADEIDIWLGMPSHPDRSSGRTSIAVYRGDYRVGVLGEDADVAYRPILMEARHGDTDVVAAATRSRASDGSWRLLVGYPARV